jgi:hypothetical protein
VPRIARVISRQMLLQQPPSQTVAQLAGPVLTLPKRHQPILPVVAQHLIECSTSFFLKLSPSFPSFFGGDSRHDRSSLIEM